MSHLVLARKYRPQRFSEVVGQDVVVTTLKAAIEKNRVAHALLFTGSRGVGKTTIARLVAKALVCLNRSGAEPCGVCSQCQSIDNFSSLDVIEIDGASHTGVDDIRDLRDNARYQPSSAPYKIFIIDEVHMLSISAFNALLKILEEPPPHVKFMFATTESHKIPKTILSRCQRYDFKRVSIPVIQSTLNKILSTEGYQFDQDALLLIAEMADGALRDALSLSEQIIANRLDSYSANSIARILGVVSHQAVNNISGAVIDRDLKKALQEIQNIYEQGLDLCQLSDALCERLRVLSLCAHLDDVNSASDIIPGLDSADFIASKKYDKADLKRLFAMALDAMIQIFQARKPLLALELLVLRMTQRPAMSDATTINFCLNKLDALLHNKPVPYNLPGHAITSDILSSFSKMVDELAQSAPAIASHLRHARAEHDSQKLSLSFSQSLHYDQVMKHKNHPSLLEAITKFFAPGLSLELILKKTSNEISPVPTIAEHEQDQHQQNQKKLYQEAEHHPLVKKTLEIFGGDITSVKRLGTHPSRGEPPAHL